MYEVAQRYPDDLHAQTLAAAAMMNTTRWDYWEKDGSPKPLTNKFLALLESVTERDKGHTGAGHLIRMPGHIYLRVGRYADAT